MEAFATKVLPGAPDERAPDGSAVRRLHRLSRGSMAHFELPAGRTSRAIRHRTVDEIWYFVGGRGEMWRDNGEVQACVDVHAGVSLTIPAGTSFQFRCLGDEPLFAVAVTMPPWPGADEWAAVEGPWVPSGP